MVKLFNIIRIGNTISCDYSIVGESGIGHIEIDLEAKRIINHKKTNENEHPWSVSFLIRRIKQIKDQEPMPQETSIAWY